MNNPTINEISSMKQLLETNRRPDCRGALETRNFTIDFSEGAAVVHLGKTLVSCRTTAEQVLPQEDRPSEGFHYLSLSSPNKFENSFQAESLCQIKDALHRTKAIDLESLVIKMGTLVWCLRSEITIIDNDGGLIEAMNLAMLSSLLSLKLPGPRGPRPLIIHHLPFAITFGVYSQHILFADPTFLETAALEGTVTFFANASGHICGMHKNGGFPLPSHIIDHLIDVTLDTVKEWHSRLMDLLGPNAPTMLASLVQKHTSVPSKPVEEVVALPQTKEDEKITEEEEEDEDEPMDPSFKKLFGFS